MTQRPYKMPSPPKGSSYIPPPPPPQPPHWTEKRFTFSPGGRQLIFGWLEIAMIVLAIALAGAAIRMRLHYLDRVEAVRVEIRRVIQERGYELNDPAIHAQFGKMKELRWLNDVENLLEEARLLRVRSAVEQFTRPNPEPISYLEHLEKSGGAFDDREAVKWLANSYRGDAPAASATTTGAAATPR